MLRSPRRSWPSTSDRTEPMVLPHDADLAGAGVSVGRKRVERLMRQAGLSGVSRRRFARTTIQDERVRPAADLVDRDFTAEKPDELWVADITYIATWTGFLYLAVVLDAFSRKVVGWAMGSDLRTQLVLDALNMAVGQRRPREVIHHSDQGSQYTSVAFGLRCEEARVRPSMGSVGDAYDNAMCESFFATLECELLQRRKFQTKAEPAWPSSSSSKDGITPAGGTPPSATNRPSSRKDRPGRAYIRKPITVHQTGGTPVSPPRSWPVSIFPCLGGACPAHASFPRFFRPR